MFLHFATASVASEQKQQTKRAPVMSPVAQVLRVGNLQALFGKEQSCVLQGIPAL